MLAEGTLEKYMVPKTMSYDVPPITIEEKVLLAGEPDDEYHS